MNGGSGLPGQFFDHKLLIVSGKGGVGKTTVAAALASLAAERGRTTLLLSTDGRADALLLFGSRDAGYREAPLAPSLYALTTDFDSLLADFVLTAVPVRALASRILASATFRYFSRATPGLNDLLILGKVRELFKRTRTSKKAPKYELVVLDAPASGHAVSLVGIPRTLLKTVPAGPLRKVARDLDAVLSDPAASALVVVAEPAELAAREAEELVERARESAGLATALLVVNRLGRSGKADVFPHLDLPTVRVPELDVSGEDDERGLLPHFKAFLAGEAHARGTPRPGRKGKAFELHDSLDLAPWLDEARLLALTGPGGVGKTTLSAAAGIAAARRGRRVLVLTVDPARRLAQALGLTERQGRSARPVPVAPRLHVLQIDPKATFERLLDRVASPAAARRVRDNRLYAGLVDSLPGVLEYMGVEALAEHAHDPDLDLIVLDTPPAARGLDFLASPDRMVQLLENDALRWFLRSDSLLGRALSGASRGAAALLRLADKVLGFGFLADLADFFHAFDGLYDGFKERSREISALLSEGRFLVVSSVDRSALRTAADTAAGLAARGASPALVLNRVPIALAAPPVLPAALRKLPVKAILESDVDAARLPEHLASLLAPREPAKITRDRE